jgi:hypothetical protein
MAELSPAAQAILTVYGRATGDISCVWHPSELKGLAAVLRAAARFNPGPFVPELFGEGWDAAMEALADIAAELEGAVHN